MRRYAIIALSAAMLFHLRVAPVSAQGIGIDSPVTTSTSLTFNHTVGTESNRILIVGISYHKSSEVNGVTYGGTSMTALGNEVTYNDIVVRMWGLVAPASGSNQVAISGDTGDGLVAAAVSFYNVDQSDPYGTYNSATGGSSPGSVTLGSMSEGQVAVGTLGLYEDGSATADSGQTEQWNVWNDPILGAGSTEPAPDGGGDVTLSWTGTSDDWGIVAVALQPASPTAVDLHSFGAREYADGRVRVRWRTGYEADNLGFHLYREDGGRRVRLTPEPVAGSALLSRAALTAGRSYGWIDHPPEGGGPVRYWLEDIDLDGTRTMHGPVEPEYSPGTPDDTDSSGLLSAAGTTLEDGERLGRTASGIRRALERGARRQALPDRLVRQGSSMRGELSARSASPPPATSSTSDEVFLAGMPAVKIPVKEEGWYRVGQPDLAAAGLDPGVDPRSLRLYVEGEEQAILVRGELDRRFDPSDAVEFYGTGQDTPWSDTRIYWLVAGDGSGERVAAGKGRAVLPAPANFPSTVELKKRSIYFPALLNGDEENFFGAVVSPAVPADQVLDVPYPDVSETGDALLEVTLQGVSGEPHRVAVLFNNVPVGEVSFAGREAGTGRFSVPVAGLLDGGNLVTLEAMGGESDVSLVDVIRLTYPRRYVAENGYLRCSVEGGRRLRIGGFGAASLRVVDVTDPAMVRFLRGRVSSGEDGYALTVRVPGSGERQLLAFSEEAVRAPDMLVENLPSSWSREEFGADVVMISHGEFLESLEPLRELRQAQGYSVAVVDVEDLYDEFNHGTKSPWALRDFLRMAGDSWSVSPEHVLLVGDASFDPRDYLGLGDHDFLPTKVVDTMYLETASDDWLVDFDGDGLAEMALGRLPVRMVEEAGAAVGKITAQEWYLPLSGEALLVADENDGFDFESACRSVGNILPAEMDVTEIFRGQTGTEAARAELLRGMDLGPSLVVYFGHGTIEGWRAGLFTSSDARDLAGGMPQPLFVPMTCLNGLFHDLYTQSLAEALLLNPNGGAAAVWASSGLTEPDGQLQMAEDLVRFLYGGEELTLGEAVQRAKEATEDLDVRRTWILFGDPVSRFP